MGDHREILVDLSADERSAPNAAQRTREWLVSTGWADPERPVTDVLYVDVDAFALGGRAQERFPGLASGSALVVTGRDAHGIGDGTGDPECPRCATTAPADDAEATFPAWWEGVEPELTCAACGFRGPIGDWDLRGSVAIGELAVVIDADARSVDPADLAAALLTELREASGHRWVLTHLHL